MKQIQFIKDFENHLKLEPNVLLVIKGVLFNPIYLFFVLVAWPITIVFLIAKIWKAHQINKDLKGKHYMLLQMEVINKEYRKASEESSAKYYVQLKHLTPVNLLSKYARKRLVNQAYLPFFKTSIEVREQIYDRLEVNQTAFFLVGQYSKIWMYRGPKFINNPFGDQFF